MCNCLYSIGLAIARRLGQDGAHVVISSRQQAKVDEALATLKSENLSVSGMVCHVARDDHRKLLVNKVNASRDKQSNERLILVLNK